jgi:hypothetical protein
MKRAIVLLFTVLVCKLAIGQPGIDKIAKDIKAVDVEKAVAEDHLRLAAEVDSLSLALRLEKLRITSIRNEERKLREVLDLYALLDIIENWGTIKDKSKLDTLFPNQRFDTLPNGALKNMSVYLFGKTVADTIRLEFPIENHVAYNSAWLQHHYPRTSNLLKRGIITASTSEKPKHMGNQMARLIFPSLVVKGTNVSDRQKFAQQYLTCITQVCSDKSMRAYSIDDYMRYEAKAVPDKNIDKLLAIRVAYIKVLKDAYAKKNP